MHIFTRNDYTTRLQDKCRHYPHGHINSLSKRQDHQRPYLRLLLLYDGRLQGKNWYNLHIVGIKTMKIEDSYYSPCTLIVQAHCASDYLKCCVRDGLFWFVKIFKRKIIVWFSASSHLNLWKTTALYEKLNTYVRVSHIW